MSTNINQSHLALIQPVPVNQTVIGSFDKGAILLYSISITITACIVGLFVSWHCHVGQQSPAKLRKDDKTARDAATGGAPDGRVSVIPVSVNYHMTRRCNYKCGFCFHTATTSFEMPLEQAKIGLKMLRDAGMVKVNFSGGEPFLPHGGKYVGELVKYCKLDLGLSSVSIVSNGSLIREKWFVKYGEFLDILAVSCDSFDPSTNSAIGRQHNDRIDHLTSLIRVRNWCNEYKVAFKLNTVVNEYNKDEDMTESIQQLRPIRWKVFQCLLIEGENCGADALRDAERFVITDDEFQMFLQRHSSISQLVPESNEAMRYSYLILDECLRFLDGGTKLPSKSILDVGVEAAINAANFDEKMFLKRGGKYTWSKADMTLDW